MRVAFHPAAQDEFIAAVEYYDAAARGLGRRFLSAVRETVDFVSIHPEAGHVRSPTTRRMIVTGFPYDVIYRVANAELTVVAVAHHRRKPGYWRQRG